MCRTIEREVLMLMSKNRLIVRFHSGLTNSQKVKIHEQMGCTLVSSIKKLNVDVVTVPENSNCDYLSCQHVHYVEPDYIAVAVGKKPFIPNDPLFSVQWGLLKVKSPQAWAKARVSPPKVPIAILDTGIDQNHEDLSAKITVNQNFTDSPTVDDNVGHGTHVAGICAAITNNNLGVSGMSFSASNLMNIKVLGDDGFGLFSWIAAGIIFAADQGAKVINMSLSGPGPSRILREAVQYARAKKALCIAAAGNSNSRKREYPAATAGVLSVAATKENDRKASFSNYGSDWVDVAAPGVRIISTCPNHPNTIGCLNYGYLNGTSMAAPFVSGLAALLWSTKPNLTVRKVKKVIKKSSDVVPGYGDLYQFGRINAKRSIKKIL